MSDYKLSDRDYQSIYEDATRSFVNRALQHKEKYGNFMIRCAVDAFIGFTRSKNLMVKDGTIVSNEQPKENEEC
jgi:hypothetical protein